MPHGFRHVLITGGSQGLGRALAANLILAGARVTILARNRVVLEQTAAAITTADSKARIAFAVAGIF